MSGAGHIFDMISKLNSNRSMRNAGRGSIKSGPKNRLKSTIKFKFKKVSEEKLQAVMSDIRKEKLEQKKRDRRLMFIVVIPISIATMYFIYMTTFT